MQELIEKLNEIKSNPITLPLVLYPDSKLNQVSKPVLNGIKDNQALQELLESMIFTMDSFDALGLSAIQVGIPLRVFVARSDFGVIKAINPTILMTGGEETYEPEGCLSVPFVQTRIRRPSYVEIEYFDEKGEKQKYEAKNYYARIIQHEMEHLTGRTFFDSMDSFQRERELKNYKHIKRKMK